MENWFWFGEWRQRTTEEDTWCQHTCQNVHPNHTHVNQQQTHHTHNTTHVHKPKSRVTLGQKQIHGTIYTLRPSEDDQMSWSGGTSPLFSLEGVSQPGASTPAVLPGTAFSSMDILYFCNVWSADSEPLSATKPNTGTMFSSPQCESLHFQLQHLCVYVCVLGGG